MTFSNLSDSGKQAIATYKQILTLKKRLNSLQKDYEKHLYSIPIEELPMYQEAIRKLDDEFENI